MAELVTVPVTDLISPALQAVLSVAAAGLSVRPGLIHLAPGVQVAHDECCDGQLYARLIEAYPSGRPFPTPDMPQPCRSVGILALRIGIGLIRCAHTIDDTGQPPTAEQMGADALMTFTDASEILTAIKCGLPGWPLQTVSVVGWTPFGPEGGCVGGEWELIGGIDWCGCPSVPDGNGHRRP